MEEQKNLKAIDLHNKVTGEELERLLKMQLAALAEDPRLAHELPPLMVWGAPGLGKSSILKVVFPKDLAEKIREKIVAVAQQMQRTRGDYELTVIQCDCEIQDVTKYDVFNPITSPEWKTYGHGGTDFRPPFEYVAEHPDIEPSCLIYITDGCGPAPERAPCFPVLWLLTADGSNPAPWGRKLRFKPIGMGRRPV